MSKLKSLSVGGNAVMAIDIILAASTREYKSRPTLTQMLDYGCYDLRKMGHKVPRRAYYEAFSECMRQIGKMGDGWGNDHAPSLEVMKRAFQEAANCLPTEG